MVPKELSYFLSRVDFIGSDGTIVIKDKESHRDISFMKRNAYVTMNLDSLSSPKYMKCVSLYSKEKNKKIIEIICSSRINGKIDDRGEYARTSRSKPTKSALHMFEDPISKKTEQNNNKIHGSYVKNKGDVSIKNKISPEDMFKPSHINKKNIKRGNINTH